MNLKFCVIFSNFHNRRNNEQCVTSHFWQLPHDIWQSHSMNSCLAKRAPFQSCVSQLDLKSFIMFPFLLCMSSFCSHPFLFFFLAVFCLWCYFGIYSFVESQPVPVKCKHKHMTTYVQNRCGFCKNSNINSVDEKQVRGSPQYYGAGTNWLYRTQIKKKCHEKKWLFNLNPQSHFDEPTIKCEPNTVIKLLFFAFRIRRPTLRRPVQRFWQNVVNLTNVNFEHLHRA